jgi:hypothetical protein
MMINNRAAKMSLLLGLLTVTGCGLVTHSSGVLPMGPDTFSVSADDLSPTTAKQAALSQAQSHCKTLGKEILVTNTSFSRGLNRTLYDVTFRCLSKSDPEYTRPTYERPADIRIEDQRK